jgi:hypothetical protein
LTGLGYWEYAKHVPACFDDRGLYESYAGFI